MSRPYVHGYDERESVRLQDQARSVVDLFHAETRYPEGSSILEAGCNGRHPLERPHVGALREDTHGTVELRDALRECP